MKNKKEKTEEKYKIGLSGDHPVIGRFQATMKLQNKKTSHVLFDLLNTYVNKSGLFPKK